MVRLRGWKARYFLQISVSCGMVWLLSCQQVGAILKCYNCKIWMKGPDNEKDPCYDPKRLNAPTIDCPIQPGRCAEVACWKQYDRYNENSTEDDFLERKCVLVKKDMPPCWGKDSNIKTCICNDGHLCNDEPGYEVTNSGHTFNGSRPTGCEGTVSAAVSAIFSLPLTLLALLSGCFGIAPKMCHYTIHHVTD